MVDHMRHRSEEEIVANILIIAIDGARKTHIMYKANLSHFLTTKYLNALLEQSLIQYNQEAKKYQLTITGKRYLEEFSEYKDTKDVLTLHTSMIEEKRNLLIQMLNNELKR